VPVPNQESVHSCTCVLGVSILSVSTIVLLGFTYIRSFHWYVCLLSIRLYIIQSDFHLRLCQFILLIVLTDKYTDETLFRIFEEEQAPERDIISNRNMSYATK